MLTEAVVRESLRNKLIDGLPSAETVYEMWVPKSYERVDLALIGTTMEGFEIKTERDTLKRLPRQASAYARLFDRCYVVLADRHVQGAIDILPTWWGVMVVDGGMTPRFECIREPEVNHDVDPHTLVRLLWKDEVYAALCEFGAQPEAGAGRFRMWEELLSLIDVVTLKTVVRQALTRRDPTLARIATKRFSGE